MIVANVVLGKVVGETQSIWVIYAKVVLDKVEGEKQHDACECCMVQ